MNAMTYSTPATATKGPKPSRHVRFDDDGKMTPCYDADAQPMTRSFPAHDTKGPKPSRHARLDDGRGIAGHGGLRDADIPTETIDENEEYENAEEVSDEEEEEEDYSDGEDLGEDMAIEEAIERLDVIGQALVTEDGLGVVDVLEDISASLKQLVKIMYHSHRGTHK